MKNGFQIYPNEIFNDDLKIEKEKDHGLKSQILFNQLIMNYLIFEIIVFLVI